jgi:hypothetical protein
VSPGTFIISIIFLGTASAHENQIGRQKMRPLQYTKRANLDIKKKKKNCYAKATKRS